MNGKYIDKIRSLDLGQLKTWQTRLVTYTGIFSFMMVFYLFIVENNWMEWYVWLLLISFSIVGTLWLDIKVVFPQQLAYGRKKDPEWNRFVRNQKRQMQNQQEIMKRQGCEKLFQEYEE